MRPLRTARLLLTTALLTTALLTTALLTTACAGPEYGLTGLDGPGWEPSDDLGDGGAYAAWERPPEADGGSPAPATGQTTVAPRAPTGEAGLADTGDGAAETAPPAAETDADPAETPAPTPRAEAFQVGLGPTPVADFVFVIDDSVSMRRVVDRFQTGIASMTEPGVFPRNSRVAVMNTTPADPRDPGRAHPSVRDRRGAALQPGFQGLVDWDRMAAWVDARPAQRRRFRAAPCRQAWFAPGDVNQWGDPCLWAHSQIGLHHNRVEAGLTAVRQWLAATEGRPRFRDGAAVNVVFISDTHDPGLPPARRTRASDGELLDLQPSAAHLEAWVTEPVASFRVHAIAPETECGEAWDDPSYFRVADETGGVTADVCTVTDYAAVIDQIAKSGARVQRPVVRLGYPAAAVSAVELDGRPVDFVVEGQSLEVLGEQAPRGALEVRYDAVKSGRVDGR